MKSMPSILCCQKWHIIDDHYVENWCLFSTASVQRQKFLLTDQELNNYFERCHISRALYQLVSNYKFYFHSLEGRTLLLVTVIGGVLLIVILAVCGSIVRIYLLGKRSESIQILQNSSVSKFDQPNEMFVSTKHIFTLKTFTSRHTFKIIFYNPLA